MDTMRILDQHIDRSLLTLPPAEAGQCQFIWTNAPRPRRSREEDEHTLASPSTTATEYKKNRKTTMPATAESDAGGLLGMLQQACRRSVRVPRKQMRKILTRTQDNRQQPHGQGHDGVRRWSVATLVESESYYEERTKTKEQ
ncbi:hypothetical protein ISF_01489 [Cordyceps fumosorosea ARSEF 2679]|uniref:Uncharacterized protein n=1 Tax=Cordyceps fumosorosea (strain ARSEF 2679) TaxID=1081104 RepID=A0A168DBV5_CORFA|nr:hypothetical protein ISF_01489 [Cordyceps fumosorosea ARSEF 2679]OAA72416.1 hypothetical protein ISF_01489 [Cordyceps fumosorosea ARSEF 2679]